MKTKTFRRTVGTPSPTALSPCLPEVATFREAHIDLLRLVVKDQSPVKGAWSVSVIISEHFIVALHLSLRKCRECVLSCVPVAIWERIVTSSLRNCGTRAKVAQNVHTYTCIVSNLYSRTQFRVAQNGCAECSTYTAILRNLVLVAIIRLRQCFGFSYLPTLPFSDRGIAFGKKIATFGSVIWSTACCCAC